MPTETTTDRPALTELGHGSISAEHLDAIVARCFDVDRATVEEVMVEPVAYPINTVATERLDRVHGWARDAEGVRREFRIFAKQLHSAELWPMLEQLPQEVRAMFTETFPWRIEIDAFERLPDLIPDGMRLPALFEVTEVADGRVTIWMEDVQPSPTPWTTDRYVRAAHGLGRLAARRPVDSPSMLGDLELYRTPGLAVRLYAEGRLMFAAVPAATDPASWDAAFLAAIDGGRRTDLRTRLTVIGDRIPALLDRIEALPQLFPHGDACPQNLLVPADDPDILVVLDWGFNTPHPVGFDLGQLLLGHVYDDLLAVDEVRRLEPLVVTAYTEGLHAEGHPATEEQVHEGFAVPAVVRSAFTTLGFDEGPADPLVWTREHTANRVDMTEYLIELGERYD